MLTKLTMTKKIKRYREKRTDFLSATNKTSPEFLLATWFGSGLIIPGPGTWGTVGGLIAGVVLHVLGGAPLLLICSGLTFLAGLWAIEKIEKQSQTHDSSFIVIDEVSAILLVMAAIPAPHFTPLVIGGAFCLFRVFDILKPWPIRWLDQRVQGGFGVMIDDTLAAVFAILILIALIWTEVLA